MVVVVVGGGIVVDVASICAAVLKYSTGDPERAEVMYFANMFAGQLPPTT